MGLVEAVVRKMLQELKDALRQAIINALLPGALQKILLLCHQDGRLFLAHGTAQKIRLSQAEPRQHLHNLHNLLLVQHHPEGLTQNRLQQGMQVLHLLYPVPAVNKVIHHAAAQRPRSVECHQGNQVRKALRLQVTHNPRHPGRLHLEHRPCAAIAQHPAGLFIRMGQQPQININTVILLNVFHRIIQDSQSAQPQKVHLQKPQLLHQVLFKLGNQRTIGNHDGHVIGNGIPGNHDACRMLAAVPAKPFHPLCHVHQPLHADIFLIELAKLVHAVQSRLQSHLGAAGNQLGYPVPLGIGHAHGPGHIPDGILCLEGAKSNNLAYMVLPIPLLHIINDFLPAHIAEIYINIRHGNPLRVQEALKEQVILQRVQIRNPQGIRHDAAGSGASPRPYRYIDAPGVVDKIPHNQEVAVKAHAVDYAQLIVQPLLHLLSDIFVALRQVLLAELPEVCLIRHPIRQGEIRQMAMLKIELHMAPFCNLHRICQRLRVLTEQPLHFLRCLQVKIIAGKPHPARVIQCPASLDAQQDFVKFAVLTLQVMGVIGSHQPQLILFRQLQKPCHGLFFLRHAMILQLDKKILPAKNLQIFLQHLFRPEHIPPDNPCRHLPGNAGTEADKPLAVFSQQLLIHSWLVIHALGIGPGHQLYQISISLVIFRQQNQVVVPCAIHLVLLMAVPGCHIHLAANDRVNPLPLAGLIKLHDAEHIAMVRNGYMLHAQLLHTGNQRLDAVCPIQQAVFSMNMQMRKRNRTCHYCYPPTKIKTKILLCP